MNVRQIAFVFLIASGCSISGAEDEGVPTPPVDAGVTPPPPPAPPPPPENACDGHDVGDVVGWGCNPYCDHESASRWVCSPSLDADCVTDETACHAVTPPPPPPPATDAGTPPPPPTPPPSVPPPPPGTTAPITRCTVTAYTDPGDPALTVTISQQEDWEMPITPPSCIARNERGEETITRHTCVIDTMTAHPRVFGAQFDFLAPSGARRQATTWSCVRDRNGTPYDYRRYGGLEVSCDDGSSTTQFITQASAPEFETTYGCADHVTSSPCPGRLHRDAAGRCVF